MSSHVFGNDIVDLSIRATRQLSGNSRFYNKVFSPLEQKILYSSDNPDIFTWIIWSFKEAAYKAIRRNRPGLVFQYKKFELQENLNEVHYENIHLQARYYLFPGGLHSLCFEKDLDENKIFWTHEVSDTLKHNKEFRDESLPEESFLVRLLVKHKLNEMHNWEISKINIPRIKDEKGFTSPPLIYSPYTQIPLPLSLSHHGRFLAFAVHLP
ncbi:MAG: 4-phosphopantetheinyl transferase family protein [Leptospiraceae bacterium]|nr:4-phosphopantetheinyl transferase family protein [Leptospiraceae bacterium]MCP5500218.1 4-phosphopantetheinyl transferase family protein [Leptospiraceae bacterium]